jgi:hypothetical protein
MLFPKALHKENKISACKSRRLPVVWRAGPGGSLPAALDAARSPRHESPLPLLLIGGTSQLRIDSD